MAAIICVTDYKMIEYHRLNESQSINFWRPSARYNIKKLYPNDLVFFLSTNKNQGSGNKKVIVGYGHFVKEHIMSLKRMWSKYENKNGCASEQELYESIKLHTDVIPEKIHCLEIVDMVYFGQPIYPEEFGISSRVNKYLESYAYLNDEHQTINYILAKASEFSGSNLLQQGKIEQEKEQINKDLLLNRVYEIAEKVGELNYPKEVNSLNRKVIKNNLMNDPKLQKLIHPHQFYSWRNKIVTIYLPMMINSRNDVWVKAIAGQLKMWAEETGNINNLIIKVYLKPMSKTLLNNYLKWPSNFEFIAVN